MNLKDIQFEQYGCGRDIAINIGMSPYLVLSDGQKLSLIQGITYAIDDVISQVVQEALDRDVLRLEADLDTEGAIISLRLTGVSFDVYKTWKQQLYQENLPQYLEVMREQLEICGIQRCPDCSIQEELALMMEAISREELIEVFEYVVAKVKEDMC